MEKKSFSRHISLALVPAGTNASNSSYWYSWLPTIVSFILKKGGGILNRNKKFRICQLNPHTHHHPDKMDYLDPVAIDLWSFHLLCRILFKIHILGPGEMTRQLRTLAALGSVPMAAYNCL